MGSPSISIERLAQLLLAGRAFATRHSRDAGQLGEPRLRVAGERAPLLRVRVAAVGEGDREGEEPVRVEALGAVQERVGAADGEARGDDEGERACHLHHDERVAAALASPAGGERAAAVAERVVQVRPRRAEGGDGAEDGGGEDTERNAEEHGPRVRPERGPARDEPRHLRRHVVAHGTRGKGHEGDRKGDRGHRRHEPLGEELGHDPRPARAEGEAQRELAPAFRPAGEHEVRDVHAGDEQHEDGRRLPDDEKGRDDGIAEAPVEPRDLEATGEVGLGMVVLETPRNHFEERLRVLRGTAVGKNAEGRQVVLVAPRDAGNGQREGRPELATVGEMEARGGDAHDRVRLAVHGEVAAHEPGVAPEGALPEVVADDDHLVAAFLPLPVEESPARRGPHAKRLEERGADVITLDALRERIPSKVGVPPLERDPGANGLPALDLPVEEVAGGDVRAVDAVEGGGGLPDPHQPLDTREVKRPQDEHVQHVEDDRVRGQPRGKSEDEQRARGLVLPHPAHGEADVGQKVGQGAPPLHPLTCRDAAEFSSFSGERARQPPSWTDRTWPAGSWNENVMPNGLS